MNKIHNQNCLSGMKQLPDASIDCCVTSPPYFGLRDYGNDEQIGLEATPELFVAEMVKVFDEVKRVLKPEGTLWLNLGDSYWGGKGQSGQKDASVQEERNLSGKSLNVGAQQMGGKGITMPKDGKHPIIKPKDLIGIPWMVAFALRSNKRSVWTVTTKPYSEAHFATFPEDLIVDCIKAGCPEGGIVLDPFMGAGTTALVAKKLNRNYIGYELNIEYLKIANRRLYNEIGIFL